MTDGTTGAVVWDASYRPFGEATVTAAAATLNQRFPGQYADEETGYSDNWNRTYDTSLGRYLQSDPIGLAGGLNMYGYAYSNPVVFIDPTGTVVVPVWVVSGGIGAVGGATVDAGLQILINGGFEDFDWCSVGKSAVKGGVAGLLGNPFKVVGNAVVGGALGAGRAYIDGGNIQIGAAAGAAGGALGSAAGSRVASVLEQRSAAKFLEKTLAQRTSSVSSSMNMNLQLPPSSLPSGAAGIGDVTGTIGGNAVESLIGSGVTSSSGCGC